MRLSILVILTLAASVALSPGLAGTACAKMAPASQNSREVDGIAVRIEDDIILRSQVRQLGKFQTLVEGQAESDDRLIQELIEQWEVQTEATGAHFPHPTDGEVDRELGRLTARFNTPAAYAAKLKELGLTAPDVRELLAQQIFVERYLDYKFRPSVLIDAGEIEAYYKNELTAQLSAKNQAVPPLSDVQEQIRELLTQKEISTRAAQWLDDTKSHLKIEIAPSGSAP